GDGSSVDGNTFVRPPASHHSVRSDYFEDISFNQPNRNVLGVAESGCAFGDGVQYWLYLRRRGCNHAQNLAGRVLLLKSFSEVTIACFELFEQAHVLNRDDCLIGEGFDQLNLLFGKRLNDVTPYDDSPNRRSFSYEWRSSQGSTAGLAHEARRCCA